MEIYDGAMFHAAVKRLSGMKHTPERNEKDLQTIQTTQQAPPAQQAAKIAMDELPIDKYRDSILHRISSDRVTVIQGGTGCGKSSRLPVMLMEDAEKKGIPCRIMVSDAQYFLIHTAVIILHVVLIVVTTYLLLSEGWPFM